MATKEVKKTKYQILKFSLVPLYETFVIEAESPQEAFNILNSNKNLKPVQTQLLKLKAISKFVQVSLQNSLNILFKKYF